MLSVADGAIEQFAHLRQHLGSRITVVQLMVEALELQQFDLILPAVRSAFSILSAMRDTHFGIEIAVDERAPAP